jgi:RNA-directed DNA polymerase
VFGPPRCGDMNTQSETRWSKPLPPRTSNSPLVRMLAATLLAGEPTVDAIKDRCARMLGHKWRWLGPLARRYLKEFAGQTRPGRRDVVAFLVRDEGFERARWAHRDKLRVAEWLGEPQQMQPATAAEDWAVPAIATLGVLAEFLGVAAGELEWFADLKGLTGRTAAVGRLRHYSYRVLAKKSGSVRLIEAPKGRLKQMQRRILAEILEQVPVHDAVHGFVKGRSIQTFAASHVGRRVVLRIDLRDFFPSFRAARVAAFFRTAGYPERVAEWLAGVCTNAAPLNVWAGCEANVEWEMRQMYRRAHLPQGAPTSPALANAMAYRLDCRLSGLARSAGAVYTRYADDLAFSGDAEFARGVERFALHAMAVAMDEGFAVNARKTRVERQGVRQRLAGLVVNERLNVARDEFDRLKAVLTNCVRHGAASQNREAHPAYREYLRGRVGFVESVNAVRGAKLREILEKIVWG